MQRIKFYLTHRCLKGYPANLSHFPQITFKFIKAKQSLPHCRYEINGMHPFVPEKEIKNHREVT